MTAGTIRQKPLHGVFCAAVFCACGTQGRFLCRNFAAAKSCLTTFCDKQIKNVRERSVLFDVSKIFERSNQKSGVNFSI